MSNHADRTGYISLRKGQVLYRERDPATNCYKIFSGMIKTCRFGHDGHRQVISFFVPRDAFGIERGYHRADAEAVTDSVVRPYRQPHGDGHPLMPEAPAFLFQALRRADECIDLLGRRSAIARLAAFLDRLAEKTGQGGKVHLPMSRADIADHLALSVETISRTFSEIYKRGAISFSDPQFVTIIDHGTLARLAGDLNPPSESGECTELLCST